jgi:hypothetical protein
MAMAAEAVRVGMASLAVAEVAEAGAVLQRRATAKARPALAVRSRAAELRAAAQVPAGTRDRRLASKREVQTQKPASVTPSH